MLSCVALAVENGSSFVLQQLLVGNKLHHSVLTEGIQCMLLSAAAGRAQVSRSHSLPRPVLRASRSANRLSGTGDTRSPFVLTCDGCWLLLLFSIMANHNLHCCSSSSCGDPRFSSLLRCGTTRGPTAAACDVKALLSCDVFS